MKLKDRQRHARTPIVATLKLLTLLIGSPASKSEPDSGCDASLTEKTIAEKDIAVREPCHESATVSRRRPKSTSQLVEINAPISLHGLHEISDSLGLCISQTRDAFIVRWFGGGFALGDVLDDLVGRHRGPL